MRRVAGDSSVGRAGVRRAFQFADLPIEGNEIVSQEGCEPAEARFDFAVESPPHRYQDAQDRGEGDNCCPVHISTAADSRLAGHVNGNVRLRFANLP